MAQGGAPVRWGETQNIQWKTTIPGRGNSSPVIWGDRIFLTTALKTGTNTQPGPSEPLSRRRGFRGGYGPQAEHRFVVLCLDKNTGEVLWERTAITAVPHEGYHHRYGSFASNSPVTDGEHVYAFFGSRGLYCYDVDGNLKWQKDFGVQMNIRNAFGEGVAPALHGDTLVLLFDHEGSSFIAAVNKNNGEELWRTPRDEQSSWATPLIAEHDGDVQVIVPATNRVRSYDLETGKLVWECEGLGTNVIPAAVLYEDIVYVMSGHRQPNLMAIRLGQTGNLTGSEAIIWTNTRGNSYTPSPLLHDGKLYVLSDRGMISCFDAKTGEPYYHQQRLPGPYSFKASPVGADGKIYLASESGDVIVLKMGEKFEVLATNTLTDEMFIASPAIVDGKIFLRGRNTLYCVSGDN